MKKYLIITGCILIISTIFIAAVYLEKKNNEQQESIQNISAEVISIEFDKSLTENIKDQWFSGEKEQQVDAESMILDYSMDENEANYFVNNYDEYYRYKIKFKINNGSEIGINGPKAVVGDSGKVWVEISSISEGCFTIDKGDIFECQGELLVHKSVKSEEEILKILYDYGFYMKYQYDTVLNKNIDGKTLFRFKTS